MYFTCAHIKLIIYIIYIIILYILTLGQSHLLRWQWRDIYIYIQYIFGRLLELNGHCGPHPSSSHRATEVS